MERGDTTQIVMFPLSIKSFLITVSTRISNHTTEQSYSYDSLLLSSAARRTVMTSLLLEKPLSLRNDLTSKQPPPICMMGAYHVHTGTPKSVLTATFEGLQQPQAPGRAPTEAQASRP